MAEFSVSMCVYGGDTAAYKFIIATTLASLFHMSALVFLGRLF